MKKMMLLVAALTFGGAAMSQTVQQNTSETKDAPKVESVRPAAKAGASCCASMAAACSGEQKAACAPKGDQAANKEEQATPAQPAAAPEERR